MKTSNKILTVVASIVMGATAFAASAAPYVQIDRTQAVYNQLPKQGSGVSVTVGTVLDNGVMGTVNYTQVKVNPIKSIDNSNIKLTNKFATVGAGYQYTIDSFSVYGQGLYGYGRLNGKQSLDGDTHHGHLSSSVYGGQVGMVYALTDNIAVDATMTRLYANFDSRGHVDMAAVGMRLTY